MNETWNVAVYLFTDDDPTHASVARAHAVLTTTTGATLDGWGRAQFSAYDLDAPEVGTEIAAARALRQLADRVLQASADDLDDLEDHAVHLV
ncbi:dsRBD fold-containing protein [uncultured Cellulomonas sp.]|uniref:dsRBD fold-containing protein n=1 Tax=uncultured Cellulomonas sp. TaxID=189682 RepID=UPI0028E2B74C|nr:dsRBD fold-containing protein [uncultured Cellulomonas sp.]